MPVKYSVTYHAPSWQSQIPLEDTKPERAFRRILEKLGIPFHSNQEDDFTVVGGLVFAIKGPHHLRQSQIEKDAWKRQQLEERGLRVIDFTDEEVLRYPHFVSAIVQAYWSLSKLCGRRLN